MKRVLNITEQIYQPISLSYALARSLAFALYAADHNIPNMSAYAFGLIENVRRVLKPFEEITKIVSSDAKKISYIVRALASLHSYLSKRSNDSGIQIMKDELKNPWKPDSRWAAVMMCLRTKILFLQLPLILDSKANS